MSSAYPPPPPGPEQPPGSGQPPPYGYQPGYPPPGYPQPMRWEDEKLWAIAAHLGPLVLGLFAPLVVWLVFRDRSAYLASTAREALNMQISYLIYGIVAGLSIIVLVGFLLLPLVGIAWLVLVVLASVKVANHEDYRYPAILRLV